MKNPTKRSRTVYKVDEQQVSKLLAVIANQAFVELGHQEAVKHAKQIFYAVKGNVRRPVTAEEASKLIQRGYSS
jgi:hypothetical protein